MEDLNISTNQSNISRYCKYDEPDTDLEKIAKRTAFVLIIVLGVFGNVFVIILAAKYTVRKNLHHLIISMAVSDNLYLLASLLRRIPWLSNDEWSIYPKGLLDIIICKILQFFVIISLRVSIITLLVISIERFRATKATLQRRRPYSSKHQVCVIGFCWLIPMLVAAYFTYSDGTCSVPRGDAYFALIWAHDILIIILCCVIFALGVLTTRRLDRPQAIQAHLNEQQRNLRTRRTRAAVRMVLVSTLLYTCCILPTLIYGTLLLLDHFMPSVEIIDKSACIDRDSLSYIIHNFLLVVNSGVSPLIYIIFLPDFREATKKVLCRKNTQNRESPNIPNSFELQLERQAINDTLAND